MVDVFLYISLYEVMDFFLEKDHKGQIKKAIKLKILNMRRIIQRIHNTIVHHLTWNWAQKIIQPSIYNIKLLWVQIILTNY